MAFADDAIVVGAPHSTSGPGAAYLFEGTTGTLLRTFHGASGSGLLGVDGFGSAVASIDGDVLVGAPMAERVYLFAAATGALRQTLLDPRTTPGGSFGDALTTADSHHFAVGAPSGLGTAYLYEDPCGDGVLDSATGEQCDDGNLTDGDCCSATCQFEAAGSPCNDGNGCTLSDTCAGTTATCVGSNPVTCSALDECHVAGTCNPATGLCSNPSKADGTPCTDEGNACTTDLCQSGACTHPPKTNGTACPDDGNACTTDACQSGACAHPAKPDGTACPDDGNACTTNTCLSGACAATCQENMPCSPGVDTICRQSGGGCVCEAAPAPPDPAAVAPALGRSVATDPGRATAFLYTGSTPVQAGVAPGTIEVRRAAVLRGVVKRRDGTALPGVRVSIFGHTELGWTRTRSDGRFDLAVNGGGPLTVRYEKTGYLPADRQVDVPWQDYVGVPDVVLVTQDTTMTSIDLTATAPIQAARGSVVTDESGTRQSTLLFAQGTQALLVQPDGSTQPISTLDVRSTEYTVGSDGFSAMPAALPPTSAYTYAVELGVDQAVSAGATEVRFDRPVVHYVENFLGFPTGLTVPVGYYDRTRAQWVPADGGRILAIVSITSGRADLDTDGDGGADSAAALAALGITDAERDQLAALYAAGQRLWRVPLTHFSSWDMNWPFGPPLNAGGPGQPKPRKKKPPRKPKCRRGSIIGCETQTLGEAVPVTGTPFRLHYQSDRVPGNTTAGTLSIPLSGATVPASLKRIDLTVCVAGQEFLQSFPATPNQTTTFTWDGRDAYGRTVQGAQAATAQIDYVYDGIYQRTTRFGYNGQGTISGSRTRQEVSFWQRHKTTLEAWDARPQGLGGWSLDIHHSYDPVGRVLRLGDGRLRRAEAYPLQMVTAAGNGTSGGTSSDGVPATATTVYIPSAVATGPDGSVYIANSLDHRIRRVAPDGIITVVAGIVTQGFSGDGGPATAAQLRRPEGVAVAPDGSIYIADTGNNRVRRVSPAGIITTVAGTGGGVAGGDGSPATQATFTAGAVAARADGTLFIGDTGNNRIRQVSPDGIITTVAGTGTGGFSGDGGLATAAKLYSPIGITIGPDGALYIADQGNQRIRRVTADGIITTVAGTTGACGTTGDGGPATQARFCSPAGLGVGPDGSLYIGDTGHNRVRVVGPDGTIRTLGGSATGGYAGDSGPATAARLAQPKGVAVGPNGMLYVADSLNYRVRAIRPPLPGLSTAEFLVPEEDGSEAYLFDASGRHLATVDTLTGAQRYTFSYDGAGRLSAITDVNGNATTVARDGTGNPTAIVAPGGQQTPLALDANGFLSSVANPAGEGTLLTSTADGLLRFLTTPRGHRYEFTYTALGRLLRDDDPAGGSQALTSTETTQSYTVAITTALNRLTTYLVEDLATGGTRRAVTEPSGLQTVTQIGTDGTDTTTFPDGRTTTVTEGPDPRFGMQAPVPATDRTTTPAGLVRTVTEARTVTLANPSDPLSLTGATTTRSLNGRSFVTTFAAGPRTITDTTPGGRQRITTLDSLGRVVSTQLPPLATSTIGYDAQGRIHTLTTGGGADARTYTLEYDTKHRLATVTNPLAQVVQFGYDDADRVTLQTLADSREIHFSYDANGNVTSVTPPTRPVHGFSATPVDLGEHYTPPEVAGSGTVSTTYAYNLDRQLDLVTRPDGQNIDPTYDSAGRLATLTTPSHVVTYGYHATTGTLSSIASSDGETLTYGYDGALLTTSTWSGPVAGTVSRTYDNDFRLASTSVNGGQTASLQYDADGLFTQVGALAFTRDAQTGLVTGTTLGVVSDARSYSGFGELTTYAVTVSGIEQLKIEYLERDVLGRLTQKRETLGGQTDTYLYTYGAAGRLETVTKNGTLAAEYTYDGNGNRLTAPNLTAPPTYDDQDRLLAYGNAMYTYTANGELATKTVAGQTTAYTYDVFGNLRRIDKPDATVIDYVIDGQNRRVGKKGTGRWCRGGSMGMACGRRPNSTATARSWRVSSMAVGSTCQSI